MLYSYLAADPGLLELAVSGDPSKLHQRDGSTSSVGLSERRDSGRRIRHLSSMGSDFERSFRPKRDALRSIMERGHVSNCRRFFL